MQRARKSCPQLSLDNIIEGYILFLSTNKYGLASLRKDFGTEDKCLDFIFRARHTSECSCGGTYNRLKGRKQYQCSKCRFQIAPLAGTIFHKTDTPLSLWFHAIMVFSNAKSGMSGKALERDLEVTYKTAWRMLKLIREALDQGKDKLKGDVEIDAGFFGGKGDGGKDMGAYRRWSNSMVWYAGSDKPPTGDNQCARRKDCHD